MTNKLFNRRSFIKSGSLAIGLTAINPAEAVISQNKVKFNDSRIKLSLAAYSFRTQFRNNDLTMEEFIDYCDKLNLDGTELTSYFFKSEEDSYLLGLRNKCFHLGLNISGTAIGNNFITPDDNKRRDEIDKAKVWIDKAAVLGAPSIRVFGGGHIPDGYSEKDGYDWVIPSLKECVDYAATKGIVLALENHGGFPTTSEQVIRIISEINSPWLGANLDTGNFTQDWYKQMAEVIPYSVVVQLKINLRSTVKNGKRITTDAERIVNMLKNEGYRRYLVLEYEEDSPYDDIPVWIDRLQQCIG
jgi:sugar phosphate isomerase/epimerase